MTIYNRRELEGVVMTIYNRKRARGSSDDDLQKEESSRE